MAGLKGFTSEYFHKLHEAIDTLSRRDLEKFVATIWKAYRKRKTIFFMGNGGSASTATHLAADIGKNTILKHTNDRELRFRTVALTDNPAWILALGNDLSYEDIFVEQLKNFMQRGDVVVAISGSGNSPNVVKAVKWANAHGARTVGLLGFDGGKLKRLVDICVHVPVNHYGYVEGIHSEIHHYIVEALKLLKKRKY